MGRKRCAAALRKTQAADRAERYGENICLSVVAPLSEPEHSFIDASVGLTAAPAAGNAYGHVAEWLRSGLQFGRDRRAPSLQVTRRPDLLEILGHSSVLRLFSHACPRSGWRFGRDGLGLFFSARMAMGAGRSNRGTPRSAPAPGKNPAGLGRAVRMMGERTRQRNAPGRPVSVPLYPDLGGRLPTFHYSRSRSAGHLREGKDVRDGADGVRHQ